MNDIKILLFFKYKRKLPCGNYRMISSRVLYLKLGVPNIISVQTFKDIKYDVRKVKVNFRAARQNYY